MKNDLKLLLKKSESTEGKPNNIKQKKALAMDTKI